MKTTDPDGCGVVAEEAYGIYRSMKTDARSTPVWDDLTNEQRGLLVWVARYSRFSHAAMTEK